MRAKRFLRSFPMKLWIILAAIVAITFFSNDFGLVDIQKTAIILAAGIDRTADGFSLTAQIAVPKGSDRTTGGTSSVEIEGQGATVSDCISAIYAKTGWVPKLVFCDLVLLGEEAARENAFDALDFFLRNEYAPDSCLLAVCEGTAADTLKATSAIDDASSLALEKLFSDAAKKSGRVMTTTLREFAIGYYGRSASGYMPYVHMTSQNGAQGGSGGQNAAGGQSAAGGQGGQEMIFSAEQTAVFSQGRMTDVLTEAETFAFSLLKGNVYGGTLPSDGITLAVLRNDGSVSLAEEPTLQATLSVDLKVRLAGRDAPSSLENVAKDSVTEEELSAAESALRGAISALWERCAQSECDLFNLRRTLYRRSAAAYGKWKDTALSQIGTEIRVRIEGLR